MPTVPEFNFRTYVRTNKWKVQARISEDSKEWHEVQVPDISAGGLQFATERDYEPETQLRVNLSIDPLMSGNPNTFVIDAAMKVKRLVSTYAGVRCYSAEFFDISDEDKVRLDILINWTIENFGRSVILED